MNVGIKFGTKSKLTYKRRNYLKQTTTQRAKTFTVTVTKNDITRYKNMTNTSRAFAAVERAIRRTLDNGKRVYAGYQTAEITTSSRKVDVSLPRRVQQFYTRAAKNWTLKPFSFTIKVPYRTNQWQ